MTIVYGENLGSILDRRREASVLRIRRLDATALEAATTDALVADEMSTLELAPVAFDFEAMSLFDGPRSTTMRLQDGWGDNVVVDVTEYEFMIPFTGDAMLITHKPVNHDGSGQYLSSLLEDASVQGSTVHVIARTQYTESAAATQEIQGSLSGPKSWLTQQSQIANSFAASWADRTRLLLVQEVDKRRAALGTKSAVLAALNIPLSKAEQSVPLSRKPRPLGVSSKPPKTQDADPEWSLTDNIYDDIIATISSLGLAAERLPTTNQKLSEEDLRNIILFVLNANYEGRAVGEAFSGKGKTDLLLMWEGRAAFIGECKIWHGRQAFTEAVGQLFGYTTWRDVRTALVIFAEPASMTDVEAKARAAIVAHPSYKRELDTDRFVMVHPQDSSKLVTVSLLFVAAALKDV